MSQNTNKGHCYCGAVQFEVTGEAGWVSHCHCESCRRHSASVVATFAGFHPSQVEFSGVQPTDYTTEDNVTRSFCQRCGTPISYQSPRWPDQIHLYLGIFDEPEKFQPKDHVYCEEQIGWLKFADGLPQHMGSGDGN